MAKQRGRRSILRTTNRALRSVMACLGALLASGTAAWADLPFDPEPRERGLPLIRTYVPEPRDAQVQNFGVTRDPAGVLYFANLGGVLRFDGAWWRLIPIGAARNAWALASDAQGRIAVGGYDDFGLLEVDPTGRTVFRSLLELAPPELRGFGQTIEVLPTPAGFLFDTGDWIAEWDGRELRVLERYADHRGVRVFGMGGQVHRWQTEHGLQRLEAGAFVTIAGSEVFRGRRVDLVAPADDGLLVSVRGDGLYRLSAAGEVASFSPEGSAWARENRIFCGLRLPDGRWAIGSVIGGLMVLRPDGGVEQIIDGSAGLSNDFVTGMTLDRDGALWLSLDQDMARVEVQSPISVFDRRSGVDGGVNTLLRHRGRLVLGTTEGLLVEQRDDNGKLRRFRQLVEAPVAVWSLLDWDGRLLVGSAFGLFVGQPGGGRFTEIPGTDEGTVYALAASPSDPDRVWVGLSDGLLELRRSGNTLEVVRKVAGAPLEIRRLFEREGRLWVGADEGRTGFLPLPYDPSSPAWQMLGEGQRFFPDGDRILALDGENLRRLEPSSGQPTFDPNSIATEATALARDAAGNLWLNSRTITVLAQGATELREVEELTTREVSEILPEPDGVVWFAATSGLHRLANGRLEELEPLPAPGIATIQARGRTLYAGSANDPPPYLELEPNSRRLRIEFSPLSFRTDLRYQTRLDPLDEGWSTPTAEPATEQLTRLPPGRYQFRVRTVSGQSTSPETLWNFRVATPWYLTPWALAGGILLVAGGIRSYAALRSRHHAERAAALENLVADQTAELRRSVADLQRTQAELEAANTRLEEQSLKDPLTGVANRRPLLPALESEWKRALRQRSSLAFLLLDLDHFKALNDSRGHREGDHCLQEVAAYLKSEIRRAGDLLLRYGGEEFGILLPETDLETATKLAEKLRQGIENLGLPHPAAPAGRVTASFGVAAWRPETDQRHEGLIEAADLALYRAKTGGRNKVRATAAPVGSRGFELLER